ncbi:hypothetical protein CRG98_019705 [Punica granatum]|uniref:Uncharacterized protein n=1 Tax=Punica granatum TaxID=22663 RepID=A0A2I0JUJ8_PUNGR|nr:hypothetical protein CRG98_019705 [Punica granatum]
MLVLTMLLMLSLVMILLPLVVASMPSGSSNVLEAHDLTSITQESANWVHSSLKEECEYLIKLGAPHMQKSTAVDSSTGKIQYSRDIWIRCGFFRHLDTLWIFHKYVPYGISSAEQVRCLGGWRDGVS